MRLGKQAVLAAEETALSAGLDHERRLYELAMATEDRVEGMTRSSRSASRSSAAGEPPPILGVVGAGTMGAGIAQLGAAAGMRTLLHDPVPEALERGTEGHAAASPSGPRRDGSTREPPGCSSRSRRSTSWPRASS